MKIKIASFLIIFFSPALCLSKVIAEGAADSSHTEITLRSEVKWEPLNPARGDKSPQAGTLWGDRNESVATGFLVKFVDGFSSPPHIHNATYRAVVISGYIHNDDPEAVKMWMPAGSFWAQPKGEIHITAAKGVENLALVEIDQGPYLVLHSEDAFDSGERPINIDVSNLVWVDPPGWIPSSDGPKVAYLWGAIETGRSNGSFVKLPAGFVGEIQSQATVFRVVVIQGRPLYLGASHQALEPGSYFSSESGEAHSLSAESDRESVLYIRTNGSFKIVSK